jgi:phosphoribosylformimino-5-aminoimidazole carboxamide ribotide isomerase
MMNKIELIPAIDIIDGKCVRLQKGDYATQKVYNENPVEVAKAFEAYGIRRLHVVDLDGAASHHVVNYRVLDMIASRTGLIIDFGGGIKTDEDLIIAFDNGAQMVTLGSVAVKEPERMLRWLQKYGPERIILGADARDGRISTNGWKEDSTLELLPFLKDYTTKGVTQVLCTDIAQDGMLQGPSIELYRKVMAQLPDLHLIASGGVSGIQDIDALQEAGIPAVVIGKAIYEGRITLEELGKRV